MALLKSIVKYCVTCLRTRLIDSITNSVHDETWKPEPVKELLDHYIPGWRQNNASLRYALNIPKNELSEFLLFARELRSTILIRLIHSQTQVKHLLKSRRQFPCEQSRHQLRQEADSLSLIQSLLAG